MCVELGDWALCQKAKRANGERIDTTVLQKSLYDDPMLMLTALLPIYLQ